MLMQLYERNKDSMTILKLNIWSPAICPFYHVKHLSQIQSMQNYTVYSAMMCNQSVPQNK